MITKNNCKRKNIIKISVIVFCSVFNVLFISWVLFYRSIFVMGESDASLQIAIDLIRDNDYIGMTVEECEAIFGDVEKKLPIRMLKYEVGTFSDCWWPESYEVVIYFDESEHVKYIKLQEIRE